MGYDLRYEGVCRYTEEGINQSKDFAAFLKKRQAIELEYAKALQKLCKPSDKAAPKRSSRGGLGEEEKASVQTTTLAQGLSDMLIETYNLATSHEKLSMAIGMVSESMQKLIKDLEQTRKEHLDLGFRITKALQDHYTALKKAKTEYDDAQKLADEASEKNISAQNTPSTKEKELEKLSGKAQQAKDKAQKLLDAYNENESTCKQAQEQYYRVELPALLQNFREREAYREHSMKALMGQCHDFESNIIMEKESIASALGQKLAKIDVEEDIQEFVGDYVEDETLGTNVSVRSLINSAKAGRLLKLQSDNDWRIRYCVLMAEDQILYLFESEDSVKPKSLIQLREHTVHTVDDSLLSKNHMFQIVPNDFQPKKDEGRIHYFSCESEDDQLDWLHHLRAAETSKSLSQGDALQIVRSLKVEVVEGRDFTSDLIRRSSDPYCLVLLNHLKVAKTVTKMNTTAPFWGEGFLFDNIHPRTSSITCSVLSQSRIPFQKDTELGRVHLTFDKLERNKQVEEWFPLISPSASLSEVSNPQVKEGELGAVRMKITLTEEKLLPLDHYQPLLETLTDPSMAVVQRIGELLLKEKEEVARRLLRIFSNRPGGCVEYLRVLTYYEIQATDDPNILFRGNSLGTKSVDQYMKMVGTKYLHNTLRNLVQTVYKESLSCEVDPTRVEKQEDLKKNWKRLLANVSNFWETINNSADKCPWELRTVFANLQDDVMAKFQNEKVKHTAVAGFIFLRFFCPAILDPKLFGMSNEHPDPNTSRTLTLVAKTLQNLANQVEFGAKEPYMADMNSFILKNMDQVKACIDKFSTPNRASTPPSVSMNVQLRRELSSLFTLFCRLNELNEAFSASQGGQDPALDSLRERLEELKLSYQHSAELFDTLSTQEGAPQHSHAPLSKSQSRKSGFTPITRPISPPPATPTSSFYAGAENGTQQPPPRPKIHTRNQSASNLAPPPTVPAKPLPSNPPQAPQPTSAPLSPTSLTPPPPPPKPKSLSVNLDPSSAVGESLASPGAAPTPSKFKFSFTRSKSSEKLSSGEDLPLPKNPPPPKPVVGSQADLIKELSLKSAQRPAE